MDVTFKSGDDVIHVKDGVERRGYIIAVCTYRVNPIALVKFEDKTTEKIFISELRTLSEAETETETEIIEKTEITITPDQFRTIAINELKKRTLDGSIVNLSFTGFIIELHKALFFGSVSENSEME